MADEMNYVNTESQEIQKKPADCIGLGFSFFISLIGVILYFYKEKRKV